MKVSVLPKCDQPSNIKDIELEDILQNIKTGVYKAEVARVRALWNPEDKTKYNNAKKKLPCFTPNGTFKKRVLSENLDTFSGIFHLDIDGLDTEAGMKHTKEELMATPGISYIFKSPSGHGYKAGIRIDASLVRNDDDFKRVFEEIFTYFHWSTDIQIDRSCKDVRRLCFVSDDPELFFDKDAPIHLVKPPPPTVNPKTPKPQSKPPQKPPQHQKRDFSNLNDVYARVSRVMAEAVPGYRHNTRLRAARLAGGLVAGGLISKADAWNHLVSESDAIADGGNTNTSEMKTLEEGFAEGMLFPITDENATENADIEALHSATVKRAVDLLATEDKVTLLYANETLEALAWLFEHSQASYQQIRRELTKLKAGAVEKEVKKFIKLKKAKHPAHPAYPALARDTEEITQHFTSIDPALLTQFRGKLIDLDEITGHQSLLIESKAVTVIVKVLDEKLAYCPNADEWHQYTGTHWQPLTHDDGDSVQKLLLQLIEEGTAPIGFKKQYQNNILAFLNDGRYLPLPKTNHKMIPFKNGLLNIDTKELTPATPKTAPTWCLPYDYTPGADCPKLKSWLNTVTQKDNELSEFLRAWLAALMHGRADLQKFLHLLGKGGSGKSTFIRLAERLIGSKNMIETELERMEHDKFESASYYGKRLIAVTDSDAYGGSLSMLKRLTGQDRIPMEKKYKQRTGGFYYEGLVILASNKNITSTDHTSAVERRRLTVRFDKTFTDREKQSFKESGGEETILHKELPGIVNWLLELSPSEIEHAIRNPPEHVIKNNLEAKRADNSVFAWLLDNCFYAPDQATQIGDKKRVIEPGEGVQFIDHQDHLYPNYLQWCERNGQKPHSLKTFSDLITDTVHPYGLEIKKVRKSEGRFIKGLQIRGAYTDAREFHGKWMALLMKK